MLFVNNLCKGQRYSFAIRLNIYSETRFYTSYTDCCVTSDTKIKESNILAEIWRHPIHSREFGSHITNVLRTLQLESHGYSVTVTELVGWEHSMKNELILAKKVRNDNPVAAQKLRELLQVLSLEELSARFS